MVASGLRDVLARGEGAGECTGEGVVRGVAEHNVCGDQVQLSVRLCSGVVDAVRWRAAGCPASMAVAALAAKVLAGTRIGDVPAVLRAAIAAHGGLASTERHAEALVLRALEQATGSG